MTPRADVIPDPGARHMPPRKRPPDPRLSALSLLDEAAHRLRSAPAATLGIYYATTLPFVLAFLYFWADMSRSADAASRGAGLALGLAVLFAIMKTGHAVFAARLRAQIAGQRVPRWTFARLARVFVVQATWQPTGLFVLPVAILVFFPLGWTYAFYQNLTISGAGDPSLGNPVARAWRHTWLRPAQNHTALGVFWALEFFAWLALMVAICTVPALLKTSTGEDNIFTRSDFSALLNSTFLAVSAALVYVTFNPLAKTFYALRCFYEDARSTGEDLLAELNALPPVAPAAPPELTRPNGGSSRPARVAVLLALALAVSAPFARAAAPSPAAPPPRSVAPGEVDRSVRDVLTRRDFAWRNPRSNTSEEEKKSNPGAFERLIKDFRETVDRWTRAIRQWLGTDKDTPPSGLPGADSLPTLAGVSLQGVLYVLIGLCAVLLVVLLHFGWRARRRAGVPAGDPDALGGTALPDLTDEAVLADRLPEDEWLTLARNLLARGERRLALRALYLSALANLGARTLVVIARHKSNRDYQHELHRRSRERAVLNEAFARLVGRFERVWYGSHPASDELLAELESDRVRLAAEAGVLNNAARPTPGLAGGLPA